MYTSSTLLQDKIDLSVQTKALCSGRFFIQVGSTAKGLAFLIIY
jgi:hypothetical protein